jgi:hypothetical protein
MKVLFIAGFGPIVRETRASRRLYREVLQIPFQEDHGYLHTNELEGAKAFALWPLSSAAESCFGQPVWPAKVPVPQAWLELDVDDITEATKELKRRGYRLLVDARVEPWGQTVSRLLSPEGLLLGITHTPWMRAPPQKARRRTGAK